MIKVEKYVAGTLVENFRVPASLVRLLAGLLPKQFMEKLQLAGLPLGDALKAARSRHEYTHWLDTEEKGIAKKIKISVVSGSDSQ